MLARVFRDNYDIGLLMIRLTFGVIFILFGWKHIQGLQGFTALFGRLGIPGTEVVAPVVAWVELIGGIAVLLGIFTRYAGGLLALVMVVSIATVRLPASLAKPEDLLGLTNSGGWNLDLCLLTMGLALLFMGPGRLSLELGIFKREI